MSFYRAKNRAVNKNIHDSNRLAILNQSLARNQSHNLLLDTYVLIPYGTIIQSCAVNAPNGWFLCNGASLSKAYYFNLFNAILYTYGGSGDNFNLPDLRGRVGVGAGAGGGDLTQRALGATGGAETHTLTADEMPAHSHGSNSDSTHGLMTNSGHNTMNATINDGNEPDLYATPVALQISNAGGGGAHNNMQPYVVLNYFIKY